MKTNLHQKPLTTNASLLKQINFTRILSLLRYHPGLTRSQLAQRTGLTRSTVTVITGELIATGLVREGQETVSGPEGGRPGVELELNPEGAFFIGAAIGDEQIRVVELNLAAQVTRRIQSPIRDTHPNTVTQQLLELLEQIWQANPQGEARSRGIGITVPGSLDREGRILLAPRLHWKQVDLRPYLNQHLKLPLFIENDANAGALVEMYLSGAMPGHSLLYLFLGIGVGAGMVLNHRLLRGAGGTACEISELMIDPRCAGASIARMPGTLEALCSKAGLLEEYRHQSGESIDFSTLRVRLQQADPIAQTTVKHWGQYLGWGVRELADILNPERIVFGGLLAEFLLHVQDQLDQMLGNCLPDGSGYGFDPAARFRLAISNFGEDSAAIGGAALVYQSLFQMPDLLLLHSSPFAAEG